MAPWLYKEYILKGVFLGLWVYVALQAATDPSAVRVDLPWVLGWVAGGLGVGLVAGTILQLARGVKPWQNWAAFPLLVLLESPTFIYLGVVGGLAVGVLAGREACEPWAAQVAQWFALSFADIRHHPPTNGWLAYCVFGGAIFGFGFYQLRQIKDPLWRLGTGLVVAALVVYLAVQYSEQLEGLNDPTTRYNLGLYILAGLPFFYLLTFCGEADESEAELMALCAGLGVSLHLIGFAKNLPGAGAAAPFLLPVTLYFVYATRVLPGLRVFKHTLRGFSYLNLGRLGQALASFRHAQQLDPNNALARQGLLRLHNSLTLDRLQREPALVELLDFSLCLDRAALLLMRPPTPAQREEAARFLELVEQKRPQLSARVDYLRAVSATHAKDYPAAADLLSRLLDPETPYHPAARRQVLYPALRLAVSGPAGLAQLLGWPELDKPGRRVEAIAAVERQAAADPTDADADQFRTLLYSQLTEAEFVAACGGGPPADFNYDKVEQLGLALLDDADPAQRDRGMAYLRIAGRGLPARGPSIFTKLADAAAKAGDPEAARGYLEQVKRAAQAADPKKLPADQKELYFAALRKLADDAEARNDFEAAIGDLRQYLADGGRQELETYRRLADLYARGGDPLNGVLMVETALVHSSGDADLLKKKDSYYYSVTPERLTAAKDKVGRWFDTSYCVRKATGILGMKDGDADLLDWATHLATLARIVTPTSPAVMLVEARCRLRRGDRDEGLKLLEDIRELKKGSGDDEDAWYTATKLLGDLYLNELDRPDLAIQCFTDYKEYGKSGADTLYKLGEAYEKLKDKPNAKKFYKAVTAYEQHPRYWDAMSALDRLDRQPPD